MKADQVQLKIEYGRLAALCALYEDINKMLTWDDDWGYLLAAHAREFEKLLQQKLSLGNKSYTISFTISQALAFQQLWQQLAKVDVVPDPYQAEILRGAMQTLDKASKQPKKQIRYGNIH
jgi:hypothetical protein